METTKPNKIRISGTYGDKVTLYLDGYVSTKYGDLLKIKSVDEIKSEVDTYGNGTYDYSRISFSSPISKAANKEYIAHIEQYIKRMKIKEGSIIKYRADEDSFVNTYLVKQITTPTLKDDDFLATFVLENVDTLKLEIILFDFEIFEREKLVSVEFTPYTLEEKLYNLLGDSTDYTGTNINDKEIYVKSLLEIIKNHKD